MEEKNRYVAKIAGKEYVIVGNRSTKHLDSVVELVNQQLDQLSELAPELTYADRSVLMAVNAVSDQLAKEQEIMRLEKEVERLTAQLNKGRKKSRARVPFNRDSSQS